MKDVVVSQAFHLPWRGVRAAAIAVLACSTGIGAVQAQDAKSYPVKPVRFIVPFAPGGGVDIVARAVAQKLGDILGQQVIVDNRGGGGTIIGTELAARAPRRMDIRCCSGRRRSRSTQAFARSCRTTP
jgi:tripartite-type tricarboxylate transporter receptor subunit TctC